MAAVRATGRRAASGKGGAALGVGSEVDLAPGILLADRYRIVALLGRGGMGEVYRADDLKLGQAVALKFLPRALEGDPRRLDRFLNEIRTAREVSHPNVCRVYDVAEVDGRHFLSMEYIDGEDLASLLRRIGRLPSDKAIDIARQLAAGLAAAHDRGVLHRDLKPANVMLDGRGRVRLTDFGLAEAVGSTSGEFAGTPAYMAPEQFAAQPATVQTDLYALGLVLYEIFTGKQVFAADTIADLRRLHEESRPPSLTGAVHDVDPAVERVILRCLEKDPRNRPASAIAVAAALPGGDPLAAALAAGETPSPDMVAAAGEQGVVRPAVAVAWLAAILIALFVLAVVASRGSALSAMPLDYSPDMLAMKARETMSRLGYPERPVDSAFGLAWDDNFASYGFSAAPGLAYSAKAPDRPPSRWNGLATGRLLLTFWYRSSPDYLIAEKVLPGLIGGGAWVTPEDPPINRAGMTLVRLDGTGHLLHFESVPSRFEKNAGTPPTAIDWQKALAETDVDPSSLVSVTPAVLPPSWADTRAAWTGRYKDLPDVPLRLEAAAYRGRTTFVDVRRPWDAGSEASGAASTRRAAGLISLALMLTLFAATTALARRNAVLGRGDRRGANRLAVATATVFIAGWVLRGHHVPTGDEMRLVLLAASWTAFSAGWVWVTYLAVEPWVRRHWPQALISWERLLAGRFGDPRIGRDILVGAAAALVVASLHLAHMAVRGWWMHAPPTPNIPLLQPLAGARLAVDTFAYFFFHSAFDALLVFVLLFALRTVLRRDWLMAVGFIAFFFVRSFLTGDYPLVDGIAAVFVSSLMVLVLLRFGLLALVVLELFGSVLQEFPLSFDFSTWYGSPSLLALLVLGGLVVYGFKIALGGKPLLGGAVED